MARLALISTLALLICSTRPSDAQSKPAEGKDMQASQAPYGLKMTTIGNGRLHNGHGMAFRIYQAPDGSDGEVTYARFSSVEDAQRQFKEWSKTAERITSREQNTKQGAKAIDDRIVGSRTLIPKDPTKTPKAEESLIIRRDTLDCYFIESMSLPTALKIEALID